MVRQGQGQSRYVCPQCGNTEQRAGRFEAVPEERRTYKGEEERLPELCDRIIGDTDGPPYIQHCGGVMVWTPDGARTSLFYDGFTYDPGDGKGERRVSSLTELRHIERESETIARNEPGRSPIAFRNYSMDRKDENTFHKSEFERGRPQGGDRRTQSGQRIGSRRFQGE